MNKYICTILLSNSLLLCSELAPVTITGTAIDSLTMQDIDPLKEKNEISSKGIELFGDKSKSSVYKTLDIDPSLVIESQDAYGLAPTKARSRGVDSNFMAMTLEGVPNYSIRPIGPRQNIYDLENLETIEYYTGALTPNTGNSVGSKAGLINLIFKRPTNIPQGTISLTTGEDDFYKAFVRADSGLINKYYKFFISMSRADAQKWKGKGDLGPKKNFVLGVTSSNENFPFEIFYTHNEQKRHDFKGLTYEQTKDLDKYYNEDYQSSDPNSKDYYDYWKDDSEYNDLQFSLRKGCFSADCLLKLYGSKYEETSEEGDGIGEVDAKRVGILFSTNYKIDKLNIENGIWMERGWLEKHVEKVSTTKQRDHLGWKWLNENHGPSEMVSPYLMAKTNFGDLKVEAGLKYFYYKEAANDTYLGNNSYSNYDDAVSNGTIAPGGEVGENRYRAWLPTLGLKYKINDTLEAFAKWGKGYQRPYRYSFAAQYAANKNGLRDKLLAQGKSLKSVVESWEMETSNMFDIGIRKYFDNAEVTTSFFYNIHDNLLSSAYDPQLGVDYLQNIGKAVIYGMQIQSNIEPTENLSLFINPAITYSEVKEDINYSDTKYSLKGNEVPETPRFTLKMGAAYQLNKHIFSVKGRYIGERYADIENEEKIDDYTTVDLTYGYNFKNVLFAKELSFQLSFLNIFDEKYISSIGSVDILEDTTSYYVGAPRSIAFNIKGVF
jgi:iron complex outermembrane receptor protein